MNLVRKGFFLKRKLTELEQKVEMKHELEADENHRELTIQMGCLRQQVMEMSEILAQKGLELDQFSEKVTRNRSIDELIQQEFVLKQRLLELSQQEQSQKIMVEQLETEIRKTVEKWKKCFAELELEWQRKNEEIGNREKELERLKLEINEYSLLKQNLNQSNQQQKQQSYSPPSSTFPVQYSQFMDSSTYSSQYPTNPPPPINICQYPPQFTTMQHSQFDQLPEPFHQPQFQPQQIRSYYNQQKLQRQRILVQEELNRRRAAVTINQHTNQTNFGYRDSSTLPQSFFFPQSKPNFTSEVCIGSFPNNDDNANQQPESKQSTTIDKSEIFFAPIATSLLSAPNNLEYPSSSSSPIPAAYSLVQSSTITSTPEISNFDKSSSTDCNPIANTFAVTPRDLEEIHKQNCVKKIKVEQAEEIVPTTDDQDFDKNSTEISVTDDKIPTIKEEIEQDSSEIQIA